MCRFDDPAEAFTHSGERISAGASSWLHLYRVCPDLRGYELLVASSNNKAVENVSAELPGLQAVADDAPDLRYIKSNILSYYLNNLLIFIFNEKMNRKSFK